MIHEAAPTLAIDPTLLFHQVIRPRSPRCVGIRGAQDILQQPLPYHTTARERGVAAIWSGSSSPLAAANISPYLIGAGSLGLGIAAQYTQPGRPQLPIRAKSGDAYRSPVESN